MQRAVIVDQAIVNDVETLDVTYSDNIVSEISFEELEKEFELKKEFISPDELVHCQRIIDNKETLSYKKLQTILNKL